MSSTRKRIIDAKNAPPKIIPAAERVEPSRLIAAGVEIEIPDPDEFEPQPVLEDFRAEQTYRLAIYGEKSSLDPVLEAWLPKLGQHIRVADVILFYEVRRGALFAQMSLDVRKRWVQRCIELAIETKDVSLIERVERIWKQIDNLQRELDDSI